MWAAGHSGTGPRPSSTPTGATGTLKTPPTAGSDHVSVRVAVGGSQRGSQAAFYALTSGAPPSAPPRAAARIGHRASRPSVHVRPDASAGPSTSECRPLFSRSHDLEDVPDGAAGRSRAPWAVADSQHHLNLARARFRVAGQQAQVAVLQGV